MSRFINYPTVWRSAFAAITALALTGACAVGQTSDTSSQEAIMPESSPEAPAVWFQYASLTGSGNIINVGRVPVTNSSGNIVYQDLILTFAANASGQLTLAGAPKITPSLNPLTTVFKAGKYIAPSSIDFGAGFITVGGPGVLGGGLTEWTLSLPSGSYGCTAPTSAEWYVGPLASNPLAARLQAAKITSSAWSYGNGFAAFQSSNWADNTLLGFSQVGNTITIASFTQNGVDHNLPVDQVTYTLVQ